MGLFSGLGNVFGGKVKELGNKYSGQKDFLEAVCAAVALVGYADGSLDEGEKLKAIEVITANPAITSSYKSAEIEQCLQKMFARAGTLSGKAGLYRELEDIGGAEGKHQMCEDAFLVGLDIAAADGTVAPAEKQVLDMIARKLRVDPKKFDGLI